MTIENLRDRLRAHVERDQCVSKIWGHDPVDAEADINDAITRIDELEARANELTLSLSTSRQKVAELQECLHADGGKLDALEAENARLREALEKIHLRGECCGPTPTAYLRTIMDMQAIATQTLERESND